MENRPPVDISALTSGARDRGKAALEAASRGGVGAGRLPETGTPGGKSLAERLAELRHGAGGFAGGLIDSTLRNPTFWYSALTAATIAGVRATAMHMGGAEAGEFYAVAIGAGAGALKEGISEAFFKSKDKKRVAGSVITGALIGALTAHGSYIRSQDSGWQGLGAEMGQMLTPAALGAVSTFIRKSASEGITNQLNWKGVRDMAVAGILAGAFSGLADWWKGPVDHEVGLHGATVVPHMETKPTAVPALSPEAKPAISPVALTSTPVEAAPTLTHTPTATNTPTLTVTPTETYTPTATATATATLAQTPRPAAIMETSVPEPSKTFTPSVTPTVVIAEDSVTPTVDTSAGARGRYDAFGKPITPTSEPTMSVVSPSESGVHWYDPRTWGRPAASVPEADNIGGDNVASSGAGEAKPAGLPGSVADQAPPPASVAGPVPDEAQIGPGLSSEDQEVMRLAEAREAITAKLNIEPGLVDPNIQEGYASVFRDYQAGHTSLNPEIANLTPDEKYIIENLTNPTGGSAGDSMDMINLKDPDQFYADSNVHNPDISSLKGEIEGRIGNLVLKDPEFQSFRDSEINKLLADPKVEEGVKAALQRIKDGTDTDLANGFRPGNGAHALLLERFRDSAEGSQRYQSMFQVGYILSKAVTPKDAFAGPDVFKHGQNVWVPKEEFLKKMSKIYPKG